MGLIGGLLAVFEKVAERADAELYDEDAVKAELTALYFKLEAGAMTEEEFSKREAELVRRLLEIEKRQRKRRAHHGRT